MDLNLQITDMAGARPEHSTVIVNFVATVRNQLKIACVMYFLIMYNINLKQTTERIKQLFQTHL